MKRGKPSKEDKLLNKMKNTRRVNVSLSIPMKLLTDIEQHIDGSNRSDKVVRCLQIGYNILRDRK